MEELESYVWDRACEIRYPFGTLTPPWEGDRMLSAVAVADAFATEGGVRRILEEFGDRLPIAVAAYRYYGFDDFAHGLDVLATHHGDLSVSLLRSAFKRFGLRWKLMGTVGEAVEIVNSRYFVEVNPALTTAFVAHFQAHRDQYGSPGHPSTWN